MGSIRVSRLPKDPGPAGWNRLLAAQDPAMPLEEKITADWLVIGAGFAGLSAARRLSQTRPDDRIVVLDAVRVGDGPAGRNSGFMIDLPHDLNSDRYEGDVQRDQLATEDNRLAIGFAREAVQAYGLSGEVFAETGKINGAATDKGLAHNADYARHLGTMDEAHEMLDAAQLREITGGDYYRGGLFTPGCVILQPAAYVRGLAAGLRSNRVMIYEDSPVLRLYRKDQWIASTPKGQVTAPKVILAVNGHLNSFGFMQRRLMHVFTYASMTRALSTSESAALGGRAQWGITPADPMGTTVRRISGAGGDRIVVRNRFTFDPTLEVDEARITDVARDHDRAFQARFPRLQGVEMEHRWGGRLCLSRNGVQVIRELEEGLISACVQNGLGTVRGTLAGMLAADLAIGQTTPALERALAQPEPTRLPPGPIARLGAKVRLKWSEARAGKEL